MFVAEFLLVCMQFVYATLSDTPKHRKCTVIKFAIKLEALKLLQTLHLKVVLTVCILCTKGY